MPLRVRLLDPRAQLDRAKRDLEVLDRPPEVALGQPELHARLEVGEREGPVAIDGDERHGDDVEADIAHDRLDRRREQRRACSSRGTVSLSARFGTFVKTRRFRSTGLNRSVFAVKASDLPRKR